MKRKNSDRVGRVFMVLGLTCMVVCLGYTIVAELSELGLPKNLSHGATLGIFVGAIVWLIGARIKGKENVAERYWWVRRFDPRCSDRRRHS